MNTLYYAPGAASLVVHWLLIELDLPYELRALDLEAGQHRRAEYLVLNPNGVVPTLVVDGVARTEAAALVMTLADQSGGTLAPPMGDSLRPEFVQWMFHLANAVQPLFRLWWYPGEAAGAMHAEAVRAHVQPRIELAWQRIDARLAERGPYLLGASPCAADFYLTMLMRWSRAMPRPSTEWPHLAAHAHSMKARPSFRTLYEREGLTDWA